MNQSKVTYQVRVPSFTTMGVAYTVKKDVHGKWACDCPHFTNRDVVTCKHIDQAKEDYQTFETNNTKFSRDLWLHMECIPWRVSNFLEVLDAQDAEYGVSLVYLDGWRGRIDLGEVVFYFDLRTGEFLAD